MGDPDRDDRDGDATATVHRAEYDWATTSPSAAVVETVAAATDRDPTAIGPLFESVDPDALDAFVDPEGAGVDNDSRLTSFEFAGKHVTVRATGHVAVQSVD